MVSWHAKEIPMMMYCGPIFVGRARVNGLEGGAESGDVDPIDGESEADV